MEKTKEIVISDAEWEIMRVVWANIQVTSREVIDVLQEKMAWKESTVKTLMRRLVEKEALSTEKEGRAFIYRANITEEETVKDFSDLILERVCDKKNGLVIQHLVEDAKLSQSDIETLILQLEEKMKDAPEVVPCNCIPGQCACHLIEDIEPVKYS